MVFVVQRCGREVNGGAEWHCLKIAQVMATHWDTEILTTCARDYMTWDNFYPEGPEQIGPTTVLRFKVDHPRNVAEFNRFSEELHSRQKDASLEEQERWMRAQGPMSQALLDHLSASKNAYDAVIFFGYLYATTYFGLPLVREKAWLAPLAHDEWPIYFSMWNRLFALPQGFFFNTQVERDFLHRRFPAAPLVGAVAGMGIDPPADIDVEGFKRRYGLTDPFLLYVGRIDQSKGCGTMFEHFIHWKEESGSNHKLVLLGQEVMAVPFHDDIIHLGFVSDDEKWAAMKLCDWLIMPSPHESLSLVLLETWSVGRPALVNGKCTVLVEHCRNSHGGLWYNDSAEFSASLARVDEATKAALGRQGQSYVRQRYGWNGVVATYRDLLPISK